MLSFDTRNRLADVLLAIGDGERQIEVVRQILCEQKDFEPYAAFKRIDRLHKGTIDARDILNFLRDNKVYYTENNCKAFIQRYDVDGDGKLVYNEFLFATLPMDNPTLRTVTTQRPNYDVSEDQILSYDIEYSLAKLIDREILFYMDLDHLKASLLNCYDFNYLDAFSSIDRLSSGKIDFVNLEEFFRRLSIYPTEDELVAILRRFDRDDDGQLSYEEFVMGLEPLDIALRSGLSKPSLMPTYSSPARSRVYSPRKFTESQRLASPGRNTSYIRKEASPFRSSTLQRTTSPLRTTASPFRKVASPSKNFGSPSRRIASPTRRIASPTRRVASPLRKIASPPRNLSSPSRRLASPPRRIASPLRKVASPTNVTSPSRRLASPPRRIASPTRRIASPTRRVASPYRRTAFIEDEKRASPVRFADSQIGYRNTVSASSYNVTSTSNGFRQASPLRASHLGGSISRSPFRAEVSRGLEQESYQERLQRSLERSELLQKSFERSELRNSARKSRGLSEKKELRRDSRFHDSDAKDGLIQALRQFMQLEKELEIAKQDLSLRPDFNLLDFFRIFDTEGRGSISSSELAEGIRRFGLYPNKEELYLFFRRFDRDNDGKLKFTDFAEAFTCKQPEYATLLNNRIPLNIDEDADIYQVFSDDTRKATTRLLRMHLDNETTTESLRQRLARRYNLNVHEAFSYLDTNEDGFITQDELGEILDKNNFYATQRELKLLLDRMDANRDLKISYSEFVQEMTPKSDNTF